MGWSKQFEDTIPLRDLMEMLNLYFSFYNILNTKKLIYLLWNKGQINQKEKCSLVITTDRSNSDLEAQPAVQSDLGWMKQRLGKSKSRSNCVCATAVKLERISHVGILSQLWEMSMTHCWINKNKIDSVRAAFWRLLFHRKHFCYLFRFPQILLKINN